MSQEHEQSLSDNGDQDDWTPPLILERGKIEAKLFSDEPDPWGP